MKKPTRLQVIRSKATGADIPSKLADRPYYVELTPGEEQGFLQTLAEYEAGYRQTGDPLSLVEALHYVESSGQTVPHWLADAFVRVAILAMSSNDKLALAKWWAVRRYVCVRDLRETVDERTGEKYTVPDALDQATITVRAEGDKGVKRRGKRGRGISRDTVEDCYLKVKQDLEQRGRESEYYVLVKRIERLVLTQAGLGYSSR